MNKQCAYSKQISLLIDNELTEVQTQQMLKHLEDCETCRQELAGLQAVDNMLGYLREIEPSPQFDQKFRQKLNLLKEAKRSWWEFFTFSAWRLRPTLAVTAAAAMICAGILFWNDQRRPQLNSTEFLISEDIEFYSDFDIVNQLDLLENWDDIISTSEQS